MSQMKFSRMFFKIVTTSKFQTSSKHFEVGSKSVRNKLEVFSKVETFEV